MDINTNLLEIVNEFSMLSDVEGILLGGSYGSKTSDENSDYDVYVYLTKELSLKDRKRITDKCCSYIELNNTFWESEDDGILKGCNIPIEIIYRNIEWIDSTLSRTLIKCEADIGYTTCFWSNIINSEILYDKNDKLTSLKGKYNLPYPLKLKSNIIEKNYQLLKCKSPAYYYQIEKALKREDFISINHRIAAFLASYFDIIFAINEFPHPGEKKILKIIKDNNFIIPKNMESDIEKLLQCSIEKGNAILYKMDELIKNLDILLENEGFSMKNR
ncbi:DUF4037 domain-containing protein [Clostridium sp. CTA-5]